MHSNKKLNVSLIQLWYHFQGYLQTRLIILQMNVLLLFLSYYSNVLLSQCMIMLNA